MTKAERCSYPREEERSAFGFWRLMALVRQTDSDDWLATAAGPLDGQTAHGRGSQPDKALLRLADELRELRGPVTG